MKLMSRNFSTKEKILIGLFVLILIGLVYYRFAFTGIRTAINNANAEAQTLQTDLEVAQAKVLRINKIESEMTMLKNGSRMGSYNNSKPETAFLHTVLSGVSDYSISFDEVTRNGDQIRRDFTLQYTVPSYKEAQNIMKELTTGEFRCLVGDVSCSVDNGGTTRVSLAGTFYETMVGGTPDSALPKDEAATAEPVELEDFE